MDHEPIYDVIEIRSWAHSLEVKTIVNHEPNKKSIQNTGQRLIPCGWIQVWASFALKFKLSWTKKLNLCGWIQVQMKLHHMAWEKTASTQSTLKAMVKNRNQEHTGQACFIHLWSTVDKTGSDSKNFKPINVWRGNKYSISTFKRENLTQHN